MGRFSKSTLDRFSKKRALLDALLQEAGMEAAPSKKIAQRTKPEAEQSSPEAFLQQYPVSFTQQRLWLLDQLAPGRPVYNVSNVQHLTGPLDVEALHASINEIVRRHESLRTTFKAVDGKPYQVIAPSLSVPLPVIDMRSMPPEEREAEAMRRVLEESRKPFDLTTGPLIRTILFRMDEQRHMLLLIIHHIVFDGW